MEESTITTYANKIKEGMKSAVNRVKSVSTQDILRAASENKMVIMTNILVALAILFMFWNYRYNVTLEKKLCKKMNKNYPEVNGKISSINTREKRLDAENNFEYHLNDYYIMTAYNACSVGNYKNSAVSLCALKDVLKQGVRGLDLEIYSINNRPVVATSMEKSFYVKETFNYVPFSDVLLTLRDMAFSTSGCPNPDDPIILHLRIKSSNQKMFANMSDLFKNMEEYMLGKKYSFESHGKNLGMMPLMKFRRKIIVVADKSHPDFLENKELNEFVNMTSNSVFMRAVRFTKDVKYSPDVNELKTFNKRNTTIVLPDYTSNPVNPNPILSRSLGCQLVAMRYQRQDAALMQDTDYFTRRGHAFVLKPKSLRYIPVYIDKPKPPNKKLSYGPREIKSKTGLYNFDI